eukprot:384437-Rhodomonas_salina.1
MQNTAGVSLFEIKCSIQEAAPLSLSQPGPPATPLYWRRFARQYSDHDQDQDWLSFWTSLAWIRTRRMEVSEWLWQGAEEREERETLCQASFSEGVCRAGSRSVHAERVQVAGAGPGGVQGAAITVRSSRPGMPVGSCGRGWGVPVTGDSTANTAKSNLNTRKLYLRALCSRNASSCLWFRGAMRAQVQASFNLEVRLSRIALSCLGFRGVVTCHVLGCRSPE